VLHNLTCTMAFRLEWIYNRLLHCLYVVVILHDLYSRQIFTPSFDLLPLTFPLTFRYYQRTARFSPSRSSQPLPLHQKAHGGPLAKSLAPSSSSLALRVLVRLNHESVQVPRRPSKQ
jgi:hypothetical protein